jgi:uncharacterized protein
MNRVYWDSKLFIYLLEANPTFAKRAFNLHQAITRRGDILCTSVFAIGEVLTGPRIRSDLAGIDGIRKFFASGNVEILPFNHEVAERYSVIRATCRVTQADAIHLAAAAVAGVELFVTNDAKLRKLLIPGIRFFADLDGKIT